MDIRFNSCWQSQYNFNTQTHLYIIGTIEISSQIMRSNDVEVSVGDCKIQEVKKP